MAACQAKGQHDAYGNGQCSPGALDTKEFRHDVDTWARRRRRLILPENWWCLTIFLAKGNKNWFAFNFNLTVLLYHSKLMATTSYQNFTTTISHCQSHLLPLQKRRNKNLPESNMAMGNPQTKWAFKSEHHWITWGDLSSKPCLRTPEGDQYKSQPKRRRYHC